MTSTLQLAYLVPNSNLTADEQKALKRLKTDEDIVKLPLDESATVLIDKTDYNDKMDALVNDKQTYEVLKRDPTPAYTEEIRQDGLSTLKRNRLSCSDPQPPKLYGLPKLHKPNIPMRPIVSLCGSRHTNCQNTYKVVKPLIDESGHKLQFTENFIDAIKTNR